MFNQIRIHGSRYRVPRPRARVITGARTGKRTSEHAAAMLLVLSPELRGAQLQEPWRTTRVSSPQALWRSDRSNAFDVRFRRQTHRTRRTLSVPTVTRTTGASWALVLPLQVLFPGVWQLRVPCQVWLPTVQTVRLCTFQFSFICVEN